MGQTLSNAYRASYNYFLVNSLHDAVLTDFPTVKEYIENNPDPVNAEDKFGFTPLLKLCNERSINQVQLDIARYLLENEADPNVKTDRNETCLTLLAQGNWVNKIYDMVEMLVRNGADVNAKNIEGMTALMYVCNRDFGDYGSSSQLIFARLLIDLGANVNILSRRRGTALHLACNIGFLDLIKLLLENGADPTLLPKYEETPLISMVKEHYNYGYYYYKEVDIELNGYDTRGAQEEEVIETMKLLLDKGCPINQIDMHGKSVLDYAVEIGERYIIDFLKENGAEFAEYLYDKESLV